MRFISTLIVLVIVSVTQSFGQQTKVVKGSVLDQKKVALPYADVRAFHISDSSFATGAMTEENGSYSFDINPGKYYLTIEFFDYQTDTVVIEVVNSNVDMGSIILKPILNTLQEVEVVSQRPIMELKLDKRVYNVASDLNNQGTNASEMLENIPSITVDAEGNVSLRGNQNVRILVDGKYSGFASSADALKQLQTDRVEKVEIITNASSRYDAQGDAGIINIILKKNKKDGFNGSVNARLGYLPDYGIGVNLNYRKDKFNYYFSYNINKNNNQSNSTTYQRLSNPDTTFAYRQFYKNDRNKFRNDATIGVDYDINDNNSIGLAFNFRSGIGDNIYDRDYDNMDGADVLLNRDTRIENQEELEDLYEATLRFRRKLKKEGGEWNTEVKVFRDQDLETSAFINSSSNTTGEQMERSNAYVTEKFFLFQTDYIYPFAKEGKIETGFRSQWRNMDNDFGYGTLNGGIWDAPARFNDNFNYDEKVHAAYLMGSNVYGKWGVQAGLRVELSDITTLQESEVTANDKNYHHFFPSAAISYKIDEMTTAQVSYSKRIYRPGQWVLMPYMKFGDNREMRVGNVNINPELTDAIEGGIMKYFTKGSLLSSLYYRRTTDKIERFASVGSDGIIYRIPMNIANRDATGLELNATYNPTNWMRFTTGFNLYYEKISGEYQGQNFDKDNYTWSNRTSANFTLPQKWRVQLSSSYVAPRVSAQGKIKSMFHADFGVSKDFWNNNATIGFNVRDVFNSRKWRSETITEYLYSENSFQWSPRSFRLTLSYRFNQPNKESGPKNGGGFDNGGGGGMDGEG